MPGFFIVLFIIGAILLIWFAIHAAAQRRKMWQLVAQQYGLRYSPNDLYNIPNRFDHFALFKTGHSKRASNCIEGVYRERMILAFDYQYTTGSGKHKSTHQVSALIMGVEINCPYLIIRGESFWDKIGGFLGFDDIDFEYEEFNRRFHVNGDKRFAYDICHSQTMEFLLLNEQLTWEMFGDRLIVYGLGRFDVNEIHYCMNAAQNFLDLIPDYMVRQ